MPTWGETMRPLFTEFSYGFGLASEIAELARSGLMSAPILPSLVDESQLGWDINFRFLGMSLFLQFKLGDFLTRRTAVQWSLYGHPYFRFEVYRRSHSPQHNLLVRLGKREPFTFYAAPIFHTDAEFNHHFLSRSLVGSTLFVPAR